MTQEEKAKAYDEALEQAKKAYQNIKPENTAVKAILEEAFPELRESEDERIRKWIANYIHKGVYSEEEHPMALKAIEWLEKQKEQKPADLPPGFYFIDLDGKKYYSKEFRYGDMKMKVVEKEQKPVESISQLTVQGKGVYKICPRCKERMVRDDSKVYTSMPPQYGYECPKCGEMEFDTVMYDTPVDDKQKGQNLIMANSPQLKEQKPTLRLVGDGLISDPNAHFELESEQKPAEWNANDKAFIKDCARILDENGYEASAERLLSMFPVKPAEWSEDIIQKAVKEVGLTQHQINWFKTNVFPPKQEWSKEDEKMRDRIIDILNRTFSVYSAIGTSSTRPSCPTYKDEIEWLKSLRPQPQGVYKQIVNSIYKMLKGKDFYGMPISNCISLLNDIRVKCKDADECAEILDEPYWKPSEEQMKALQNAVALTACDKELVRLYNQLKKLM